LVLPRATTLSEDLHEEEEKGLVDSMGCNKLPGKRTIKVKGTRMKKD
jgi:hypothetical protein